MRYEISFTGRPLHALGVFERFTEVVEGATIDAAVLRLYDKYENVHLPKATATDKPLTIADSVLRYVPTYVNQGGKRTLMLAAQGRYTYETEAEAQHWIDEVRKNTTPERIKDLWGADTFEVRPVECYAGHFDPKTIWFD